MNKIAFGRAIPALADLAEKGDMHLLLFSSVFVKTQYPSDFVAFVEEHVAC